VFNRPSINRYNVTTRAANGSTVEALTLWSNATIVTRTFSSGFAAPVLPSPGAPAQLQNRDGWVRSVRLTLPTAQILHIREIMVFDATLTNVARNRSCTTSSGERVSPLAGVGTTGCDRAVDHIIDFDNTAEGLGLFHSNGSTAGQWAEWDL
jgi:hypothetical protein